MGRSMQVFSKFRYQRASLEKLSSGMSHGSKNTRMNHRVRIIVLSCPFIPIVLSIATLGFQGDLRTFSGPSKGHLHSPGWLLGIIQEAQESFSNGQLWTYKTKPTTLLLRRCKLYAVHYALNIRPCMRFAFKRKTQNRILHLMLFQSVAADLYI